MTKIHKANTTRLKTLFAPLLMVLTVLATAQSDLAAAADERLNKEHIQHQLTLFGNQIENMTSSHEAESMRIALNELIQQLKDCDRNTQNELQAYQQVRGKGGKSHTGDSNSGSKTPEQIGTAAEATLTKKASSTSSPKSASLDLAESNLQKRLVECQYLLLQATQAKDKLLTLSTQLQLSDYFQQRPFYWSNEGNNEDYQEDPSSINIQSEILWSVLFTLFLLVVLSLITKNSQLFVRFYPVLINTFLTLVIVAISVYWLNFNFELNLDIAWLLATSMMLPIAVHFYTRQSLFFHFAAACLVIVGSTLLITDSQWLQFKLFHAGIYIGLVFALLLLSSRSLKQNANFFVGGLIALLLLLEGLEFHTLAHLSLIWLTSGFVLVNVHRLVKLCIVAGGKMVKRYFEKTNGMPFEIDNTITESLEETPGIKWISGSIYITLISVLLFNILPILGLPHGLIESFQNAFSDGIQVGTVELNAKNILIASFVFGLILFVSWIIKSLIETSFGRSVTQKQSAQIAKASLFWYTAILTAALVALSISGFEVQNLAIIAGAFSVGIGFGLQNIVSNFVSGLILLIERPVKPGDWVIIGNTEGLIQRINIRATQITTFDRADILVPNSELVSNQVTNLMLGDSVGRLKFNVGVAYGSDTEKVASLLLSIVKQHPEVLTQDQDALPSIALLRFGDSSVDFEVRCFLRDIKQIVVVRSDLLHAIYKAFKENDIEIPFPQRDIYIKRMVDGRKNAKQEDNDDKQQ